MANNQTHWRATHSALKACGPEGVDGMADLLANLMHLAEQYGVDFEERLENARMHFGHECEVPDDLVIDGPLGFLHDSRVICGECALEHLDAEASMEGAYPDGFTCDDCGLVAQ